MSTLPRPPVFGARPPGVAWRGRGAAYAVIAEADGRVAAVRGPGGRYWLPGGGSRAGEAPEETVAREVRQELGRETGIGPRIARAVQHFHAADDGCWYEMAAVFIRAEPGGGAAAPGEHGLRWIDPARQAALFFHASHAWAAALVTDGPLSRTDA